MAKVSGKRKKKQMKRTRENTIRPTDTILKICRGETKMKERNTIIENNNVAKRWCNSSKFWWNPFFLNTCTTDSRASFNEFHILSVFGKHFERNFFHCTEWLGNSMKLCSRIEYSFNLIDKTIWPEGNSIITSEKLDSDESLTCESMWMRIRMDS